MYHMSNRNILIPSTASTHFLRTLGIPFQFVEPSEAIEHGDSNWVAAPDPGFTGVSSPEVVLEVVEHTDAFLFPSNLPGKKPGIEPDEALPSPRKNIEIISE